MGLEYTLCKMNNTFGNTTLISCERAVNNEAFKHILTSFNHIDGSSINNVSSMFICRLYRDVSVAGNLADFAYLLEFDFHIEIDTAGSQEEYIKTSII